MGGAAANGKKLVNPIPSLMRTVMVKGRKQQQQHHQQQHQQQEEEEENGGGFVSSPSSNGSDQENVLNSPMKDGSTEKGILRRSNSYNADSTRGSSTNTNTTTTNNNRLSSSLTAPSKSTAESKSSFASSFFGLTSKRKHSKSSALSVHTKTEQQTPPTAATTTETAEEDDESFRTAADDNRRSVTFADKHGGTIATQKLIPSSPESTATPPNNNIPQTPEQMARLSPMIVLLMCPMTKQFELINIYFDSQKRTQLRTLLHLIPQTATFGPVKRQQYIAFCRPGDGTEMVNALSTADYFIQPNEIVIAIPKGINGKMACALAKPILTDRKLLRLIKRLKRTKPSSSTPSHTQQQTNTRTMEGPVDLDIMDDIWNKSSSNPSYWLIAFLFCFVGIIILFIHPFMQQHNHHYLILSEYLCNYLQSSYFSNDWIQQQFLHVQYSYNQLTELLHHWLASFSKWMTCQIPSSSSSSSCI